MAWAPDFLPEFERRFRAHNRAMADREVVRHLKAYYADGVEGCVAFINDWCVTFDPRNKDPLPKLMPFMLFPRQVEFVHFILGCLNDKESGLVEKARDMGATWLCCAISVWLWLFHPGTIVGWGSRNLSYVDVMGDPKAIFPKIRQIINNLPFWLRPEGYRESIHGLRYRIINPENESAIIGEGGDNMGRGGRTSIYFKDESAHYEHPELIEAALGDNTDVQIDISSVNGNGNVFYRRRMAGEIWMPDRTPTPGKTRVFILDWRQHPGKTEEWYEKRKAKSELEGLGHIFAQEVDRDYSGSQVGVIIKAEWVRAAVDAHIKLKFAPGGSRIAGQDIADGGGDKNALAVVEGVILRFCDHWAGEADDAADIAIPACTSMKVTELYYDMIGVGSGFKSRIKAMRQEGQLPGRMTVTPWNAGGKVLDPDDPIIPGDHEAPTNEAQYFNLKAQAYFRLRSRFFKTYCAVVRGMKFDQSELISIDSSIAQLEQLKTELSQPIAKAGPKGKTLVDKKSAGQLSPNLADAVAIAYTPTRELSIFDVL